MISGRSDFIMICGFGGAIVLDSISPTTGTLLFQTPVDARIADSILPRWRACVTSAFNRRFPPGTLRRLLITEVLWENLWISSMFVGSEAAYSTVTGSMSPIEKTVFLIGTFVSMCIFQHTLKRFSRCLLQQGGDGI